MRIALSESIPILEEMLNRALAKRMETRVVPERAVKGRHYDLFLSDRAYLPSHADAELYLIPNDAETGADGTVRQILTGGMGRADPVTLSSIGDDRAMLCLQREIRFSGQWIGPFEKPIAFDRRYSLYKNLAVGFALALTEIVFGEE